MSTPSSLPVSNPQSTTTQTPSIATPALRSFISRLSSSIRQSFSQRRPWYELVDRSAFSRPDSLSDAASRIRKNFQYFRVNYTFLLAVVFAFSLLSHPFSLIILLSLLAAWLFRSVPEELFFDDQEQTNAGLLSFLGGATSSTAAAPPPSVARV
ncbi:hypothetical protein L1987_75240 [Smallanthus sonchifolius]|uniref:Uncharacterized protein n=1 Tax=Smallanthus sonchifolius TaxID=185202 RepID=A0ACB9A9C3_9ASTR|nr:hypothetical protein L1987_75240 [Smallanthus sonchifolius]